jgi:hypothetical protein
VLTLTQMIGGVLIMLGLIVMSIVHSMHFPDDLSETLLIFRHDPSSDSFGVCVGQVHPAGLRGEILAWTDGLLGFMGTVYLGSS